MNINFNLFNINFKVQSCTIISTCFISCSYFHILLKFQKFKLLSCIFFIFKFNSHVACLELYTRLVLTIICFGFYVFWKSFCLCHFCAHNCLNKLPIKLMFLFLFLFVLVLVLVGNIIWNVKRWNNCVHGRNHCDFKIYIMWKSFMSWIHYLSSKYSNIGIIEMCSYNITPNKRATNSYPNKFDGTHSQFWSKFPIKWIWSFDFILIPIQMA